MSITVSIEFESTSICSNNGIFSACTILGIVIVDSAVIVKFEFTSKLFTVLVEVNMDAI